MRTIFTGKITAYLPTRADIESVTVGSFAPNAWGQLREVVEISAKREDIMGRLFVCYYTEFGPGSRISDSLKQDELHRDVATSRAHTSRELDDIEHLRTAYQCNCGQCKFCAIR
jgi:hypothetical protein